MKQRQVLLNESWSIVKKDKSCVGGLKGGDSGTAGALGQSVVSNCESEFKDSSTLSCRGSTLVVENNQIDLTSTSDNSVILAGTSSYSTIASTLDNIVTGSQHQSLDSDDENSHVDKVPVE